MGKKTVTALTAAALMLGPSTVMLGTALLITPDTNCVPGGALTVSEIPSSLTATTAGGMVIILTGPRATRKSSDASSMEGPLTWGFSPPTFASRR